MFPMSVVATNYHQCSYVVRLSQLRDHSGGARQSPELRPDSHATPLPRTTRPPLTPPGLHSPRDRRACLESPTDRRRASPCPNNRPGHHCRSPGVGQGDGRGGGRDRHHRPLCQGTARHEKMLTSSAVIHSPSRLFLASLAALTFPCSHCLLFPFGLACSDHRHSPPAQAHTGGHASGSAHSSSLTPIRHRPTTQRRRRHPEEAAGMRTERRARLTHRVTAVSGPGDVVVASQHKDTYVDTDSI